MSEQTIGSAGDTEKFTRDVVTRLRDYATGFEIGLSDAAQIANKDQEHVDFFVGLIHTLREAADRLACSVSPAVIEVTQRELERIKHRLVRLESGGNSAATPDHGTPSAYSRNFHDRLAKGACSENSNDCEQEEGA